MPKSQNGIELVQGAKVTIEATVISVTSQSEDGFNCLVKLAGPEGANRPTEFQINSKCLTVIESPKGSATPGSKETAEDENA